MAVRLSALRAGRPLPPGRFLVLISVRDWVEPRDIVRLEGLGQLKNPETSWGIEPATFRLVAKCFNQLRYRVPRFVGGGGGAGWGLWGRSIVGSEVLPTMSTGNTTVCDVTPCSPVVHGRFRKYNCLRQGRGANQATDKFCLLLASWLSFSLPILPWMERQHAPPKRRWTYANAHDITPQKYCSQNRTVFPLRLKLIKWLLMWLKGWLRWVLQVDDCRFVGAISAIIMRQIISGWMQ
jgi:hypothetical protein